MTEITKLYIGNRNSGKTRKLIEELNINRLRNPGTQHIIVSSTLKKRNLQLGKRTESVRIIKNFKGTESLVGCRGFFLYIDELDIIPFKKSMELLSMLPSFRIKGLHVNTSPIKLRDKKDLNTNHTTTEDPLIKVLQITDFEFDFLFNKATAEFYYRSFAGSNGELYYTEGLGLISIFD